MTSTRLPGKVLMEVCGKPMLGHQLERLERCRELDEVVVATTTNADDEPVAALAERMGLSSFRGSEHDVLSRYVGAARRARADVVVRITADCPLIDPETVDLIVREIVQHAGECDYASNLEPRTYPRGLDAEALFLDTLLRIDRLARSSEAREHVTVFAYRDRPDLFLRRVVQDRMDNSDLTWTVDTGEDLDRIRRIYDALGLGDRMLPYQAILAEVRGRPELH